MEIDKLRYPHIHLCLSCQAPFTLYYDGSKEPDIMYVCGYCGVTRRFGSMKNRPFTATEINERYEHLTCRIQEEMNTYLEPLIQRIIKIVEDANK
jgi:hypothetical protein